jgi:hypothetical protein
MKQFGISGECLDQRMDEEERKRRINPGLFGPRYKRYAAWPAVIWCRLNSHFHQPTWNEPPRCLRCGDPR